MNDASFGNPSEEIEHRLDDQAVEAIQSIPGHPRERAAIPEPHCNHATEISDVSNYPQERREPRIHRF